LACHHSSRILERRIAVAIPPSRPSPIQTIPSATVAQHRKAAHNSLKRFEVASWAHVRRKLYDIHVANGSAIAADAIERIGSLYGIRTRDSR
jgi:Transposase IS66 family